MESLLDTHFASPVPGLGWPDILLRLLGALILGGVIGWERERQEKSAGLRTHMLVSLAALTSVMAVTVLWLMKRVLE